MNIVIWLVIAAVMVVLEIASLGLTTIWFAGGALVAALAALLGASWIIQLLVFGIVVIVLLVFTRPVVQRKLMKNSEKTNIESAIGEKCYVIEEINNNKGQGTVMYNGLEWTARSEDGTVIERENMVEIKAVSGVKLIVVKVK